MFYLGQNEDCSLGDCTKEVGGKVSIYVISVKGENMQTSTYFSRRFLLVS